MLDFLYYLPELMVALMSVKSPLGLVLYCYLNMPTINKTYLILSVKPEIVNRYDLWVLRHI
jgi:hypothetical protein